jgi:MFS transporter, ACS family, hexuronate transporter
VHDSTLTAATPGANSRVAPSTKYQWLLIALLSFNFGVVFFDRNALSFLTPFIQPELKLTNTQIGLFASALSFSWAVAGLFIGWLSDKLGKRKILLVISTLVFSLSSVLSGLAGAFLSLLGARLLMGVAEGGIMPISQTLIAAEVAHERRGLAQGITQNFGANLLANFLGPIVIVAIGTSFGWRNAFFLTALPGFISAVLIWMLVREPAMPAAAAGAVRPRVPLLPLLTDRTLILCVIISVLLVAFFVVFMTFMPLYLTQVRGVTNQSMSYIMSTFGLASMAVAFLVPGSSDRFGRRPVVFTAALLGLILPLGVLLTTGSAALPLVISIALGCCVSGCFPLVMATIPSEHVSAAQTATALSLTMGISEVVGGVAAPYFAGGIADAYGLGAVMWILAGICLSCALLALLLKETAPRVLARRAVPT